MAIAKALASEPRAWERARARTGVSPRVAGGLDLQLITTPSAFDGLEPEWNDLFQRAADPSRLFLGFNWNWHWCNHYLKAHGGSLEIGRAHV